MDLTPLVHLHNAEGATNDRLDALPDVAGALCARVGGLSLGGGLYRIHTPEAARHWSAAVADTFPEFAGRAVAFGCDWLGRQFAEDDRRRSAAGEPLVLMFEPGTGEALEVPASVAEFHESELVNEVKQRWPRRCTKNGAASQAMNGLWLQRSVSATACRCSWAGKTLSRTWNAATWTSTGRCSASCGSRYFWGAEASRHRSLPDAPQADDRQYHNGPPGTVTLVWVTSYDPNNRWPPVETKLHSRATVGQRNDWGWAALSEPIAVGGTLRSRLLIAARHQGDNVWEQPQRWPVHVYLCSVPPEREGAEALDVQEVTIEAWGLLHQSAERATADEY